MSDWTLDQADFVVLRNPLLAEDTVNVLMNENNNISVDENIKKSLRQLIKLCKQKIITQAIKFASPTLAEKIEDLTEELSIENLKLAASIYKYITRMSTRCTPFGAFSSVSTMPLLEKQDSEDLNININPKMRLFLRLDNSCVIAIAKHAESQSIKSKNLNLKVRKNSSLYKIGDEFRFVVKNSIEKHNEFNLDSVKFSEAIDEVLGIVDNWFDLKTLIHKLTQVYEQVDINQLTAFVYNMLENQLLESNLTVVISSKNSLQELYHRAIESQVDASVIEYINKLLTLLGSIKSLNDPEMDSKTNQIKEILNEIIPEHDLKKYLHVDSFRDVEQQSFNQNKINPILETVNKLADFFWQPYQIITDFTNKFSQRYGNAEVPLLEALDTDSGLSFGQTRGGRSPLLKGINPLRRYTGNKINWNGLDKFIFNKVVRGLSNNDTVIKIKSSELEKYKAQTSKPNKPFDDTFTAMGVVLDQENEDSLFYLQSVTGPSSLMLLGRFCCGTEDLLKSCKALARQEQKQEPNTIYAEVIHYPQSSVANISCRPSLRDYEIVYGPGDSNLSHDKQIKCDDLFLKMKSGHLCLFSKRLNKEIKPRLASAHNTSGLNLPVYQFLHALQYSNGVLTNIQLSESLNALAYLPEIQIDNLIISQKRWLIEGEEIKALGLLSSDEEKIIAFDNLRQKKKLTRHVALSEGDSELEFDLNSSFSKLIFINEIIKRKTTIKIVASLKGRTDSHIKNESNVYRHELIIPCNMKLKNKQKAIIQSTKPSLDLNRIKDLASLPGENWKYLKIYTGEACADKFLCEYIAPLANELVQNKLVENWHFIRYQDPEFHIRLRFKLNSPFETDRINKKTYTVLRKLYMQGLVNNVVEGIYTPEIQRYGGTDILPICEELFHLNSVITTDFINSTYLQQNKDQLRWLMCLRLAWQVTSSVCDSFEEMEIYFKRIAASYNNEFGNNSAIKDKISHNYRHSMKIVSEVLTPEFSTTSSPYLINSVYPQYAENIKALKIICNQNGQSALQIAQSLIHMDCNRIFVISPRVNEWIIYNYLARYTRTVIARNFTPGKEVLAGFSMKTNNKSAAKETAVLV